MELPHLTLFIRRFWRMPGRTTVVAALGWLIVVLVWPYFIWNSYADKQYLVCLGILLLGHYVLFYIIAVGMRGLTDDIRGGIWGWHATPLSNVSVLVGSLAATGIASIVPTVGLFTFLPVQAAAGTDYWGYDSGGCQLGIGPQNFDSFILLFIIRLLHYALMAGCMQLVFRHTSIASAMPSLLAGIATLIALWEGRNAYVEFGRDGAFLQPWAFVLWGLLGFTLLASLIVWAVTRTGYGFPHLLLIVLILLLPLALACGCIYANLSGCGHVSCPYYASLPLGHEVSETVYLKLLGPLHSAYGHVFPNLESIWASDWHNTSSLSWFGNEGYGITAVIWMVAVYLFSALLWWFTALLCLDIARNPQKYVLRRRR